MKVFIHIIILLTVLVVSCTKSKVNSTPFKKEQTVVYWVGSTKGQCEFNAERQCVRVCSSDSANFDPSASFDAEIQGFDFKPGYLSKIRVLLSADEKGTINDHVYKLVEVLEQKPDPRFQVHDIWVIEAIDGKEWDFNKGLHEQSVIPQLEINVTDMKIMGTDGCNKIQGAVVELTEDKIQFGPLRATRKSCPGLNDYQQFDAELSKVKRYKRQNLKLILYSDTGLELLVFEKVD